MVITHDISMMNNNNIINKNNVSLQKKTEKLSSGYRINISADDAAGLSISEKLRIQIRDMKRAGRNIQDGMSLTRVADGALKEVTDMLQRERELMVQGANDTNTPEDRQAIQSELSQLNEEIERVFSNTTFNTKEIFKAKEITLREYDETSSEKITNPVVNENNAGIEGTYTQGPYTTHTIKEQTLKPDKYGRDSYKTTYSTITSTTTTKRNTDTTETSVSRDIKSHIIEHQPEYVMIQSGSREGDCMAIRLYNFSVDDMKLNNLKVDNNMNAAAALETIDDTMQYVNGIRSYYGAIENRLEHAYYVDDNIGENTQRAESSLRDADMASEMSDYWKQSILVQSASAIMSQNSKNKENVLTLLNG